MSVIRKIKEIEKKNTLYHGAVAIGAGENFCRILKLRSGQVDLSAKFDIYEASFLDMYKKNSNIIEEEEE